MDIDNLITAIDDDRIWGHVLLAPLQLSAQAVQKVFSPWPADLSLDQKIVEVSQRCLILLAANIGVVVGAPLAVVGIGVKWVDLSLKIDQLVHKGPAISYHLPLALKIFSRLGDRTVTYLNTKYVAEQAGLPLYFVPFKGSDIFAFSQEEKLTGPQYFKKIVHLNSAEEIAALKDCDRDQSTLYLLPFFSYIRSPDEGQDCLYVKHHTDWDAFRPRVKELLRVIKPHKVLDIPKDAYTIALHVRDGGDFDTDMVKTLQPLKLPCMDFYLNELERVLTSGYVPKNTPIFIHIFTDALEPKKVHDQVEAKLKTLGIKNVKLSYTEKASLVDDIANMGRFKCMIRADSNLSGPIVGASDSLELEIYPTYFSVDPDWNEISISRVKVIQNRGSGEEFVTHYAKKVLTQGMPICFFKKFYDSVGLVQKA